MTIDLDARVLGQLLLMQSVVINLPEESISSFIESGLKDLPGVGEVHLLLHSANDINPSFEKFPLRIGEEIKGELLVRVDDPVSFTPYASYLDNFCFMLAVIFEEREQRGHAELYSQELESRVQERTQELKVSDHLFQTAFETSSEGMCLVSPEGNFLRVNERMCQIFGYENDQILGLTFMDVTHPDDLRSSMNYAKKLISGELSRIRFEKRYVDKKGNSFWAQVSSSLVRNVAEEPVYFVTTILDISKRKQAEIALARSEERLQLALDASSIALWDFYPITGDVYFSPSWFTLLGYESDEFPQTYETWRDLLHPEDVENAEGAVLDHIQSGLPLRIEFRMKTKDGSWKWILSRGQVVEKNASGHAVRMTGTHTDISKRKEAELELVRAKEQAEAASRVKNEFLANMSHEIRTPLNGVMGMLQLVQFTELDGEQGEYVSTALNSSKHLMRILSDILDLAKVEAGTLEISRAEFKVAPVVQTVIGSFMDLATSKGLKLHCEIDENVPPVLVGDSVRIRQILFNLVGNAVKYTNAGEVRLEVYLLPNNPRKDALNLHIAVADTGIGIPDDKLGVIFDSFTQVDGSYTRRYGGAGLGLAIVKRLASILESSVHICTEEGVGTEVHMTLPVTLPHDESVTTDIAPLSLRSGDQTEHKILVVEDDRVNMIAVTRLLEKLGYKTAQASNGEEALKVMQNEKLSCVLMDIQMPVMDGLEATRLVRTGKIENVPQNIPIIALTAHAMAEHRQKFIEAGMDDYIAKPVEVANLQSVLGRIIASNEGNEG